MSGLELLPLRPSTARHAPHSRHTRIPLGWKGGRGERGAPCESARPHGFERAPRRNPIADGWHPQPITVSGKTSKLANGHRTPYKSLSFVHAAHCTPLFGHSSDIRGIRLPPARRLARPSAWGHTRTTTKCDHQARRLRPMSSLSTSAIATAYTAGSIHATTRWLLSPYPRNTRARGSYLVQSGPYLTSHTKG